MSYEEPKSCFLQFKFFYNTSPGEEIHIVGNIPDLGNWVIEKSEKMVTSNQDYPLWKSKESIRVLQNSEVQYKYIIFKNGKFFQWEKTENNANRVVKIPSVVRLVITDPEGKIEIFNPAYLTPSSYNIPLWNEDEYEYGYGFDKVYTSNLINSSSNWNIIDQGESDWKQRGNDNYYNNWRVLSSNPNNDGDDIFASWNYEFDNDNSPNGLNDTNTINTNNDRIIPINIINNKQGKKNSDAELSNNNSNKYDINNNINSANQNSLNWKINDEVEISLYELEKNDKANQVKHGNENIIFERFKSKHNTSSPPGNSPLNIWKPNDNEMNVFTATNRNNQNISKEKIEEAFNNKEIELSSDDEIIICSFYLPINACKNTVTNKWEFAWSNEPLYHTLYSITKAREKTVWIGILKNFNKISTEQERVSIYNELKSKYNMYALDITTEMYSKLFLIFNEFIEPLFHYISISSNILDKLWDYDAYWSVYRNFNDIVSKQILELLTVKSLIFLNDYPFYWVPSWLYTQCSNFQHKLIQEMSIGLFMHSPFPSEDVFKKMPCREEILKSIMNCSVIGFHTFDSSRNFIRAAKRLLSLDCESTWKGDIAWLYFGRKLIVRVLNLTPEASEIQKEIEHEDFKEIYTKLTEENKNKFVFVSIDNVQFLSCIKQKLEGFRRFIRDIGDNRYKVKYWQYIKLSSDDISISGELLLREECVKLLDQIKELAVAINAEFNTNFLELVIKPNNYSERLAIFAVGNCFIRTSKRESFSWGIYEFLLVKMYLNLTIKQNIEYMISELSGVNNSLAYTIKINPFDANSIHKGFMRAFQPFFDKHEHDSKEKDFNLVKKSSARNWWYAFCKDIKNYKKKDSRSWYMGSGLGLSFRLMKIQSDFTEISKSKIVNDFSISKRRVLFFNYEEPNPINIRGMLMSSAIAQSSNQNMKINITQIYSWLDSLGTDLKNSIFLISSQSQKSWEDSFSNYKNLNWISENGYSFKLSTDNKWALFNDSIDTGYWINFVVRIWEPYTERWEGSFIEERDATVIWNYQDADIELGKIFARTICNELENSCKNYRLSFRHGDKFIEISNKEINKGAFCSFILREMGFTHEIQFIMAIGNGYGDEVLFSHWNKWKIGNWCKVYSVIIGKKPSNAMNYASSITDVKSWIEDWGR